MGKVIREGVCDMFKWLSCLVVIVGLLCGQVFAGENIYGTTPIDYFGKNKEKTKPALKDKKTDTENLNPSELLKKELATLESINKTLTQIAQQQMSIQASLCELRNVMSVQIELLKNISDSLSVPKEKKAGK